MTPTAIPWYKSKVIVGAVISIITKILVMTGLVTQIAPEDAENITNLIVLVLGGVGDLVAIGARVAQKHAPDITVATTEVNYRKVQSHWIAALGAVALVLTLSSCGVVRTVESAVTGGPVTVADRTKLDEQVGISLTTAYTATSKAAGLLIETRIITDPATIKRWGELDRAAFNSVMAVRQAYLAANNASYLAAIQEANAAVKAFLAALQSARGRTTQAEDPDHLTPDERGELSLALAN